MPLGSTPGIRIKATLPGNQCQDAVFLTDRAVQPGTNHHGLLKYKKERKQSDGHRV